MKNIEKYPNTRDAWEAWKKYNIDYLGSVDFARWLDREYVELREPTLAEAAGAVIAAYSFDPNNKMMRRLMAALSNAVSREKRKPVRNFDMYATAKEAQDAFTRVCTGNECRSCPYRRNERVDPSCFSIWLYAEADAGKEEKAK